MIERKDMLCKCKYPECKKLEYIKNATLLLQAVNKFQGLLGPKHILDVNCGYRCPRHNKKVGGVKNSQHRISKAMDLSCETLAVECMYAQARDSKLFTGIGLYNTFIHADIREGGTARWDKRNAKRQELLQVKLR